MPPHVVVDLVAWHGMAEPSSEVGTPMRRGYVVPMM